MMPFRPLSRSLRRRARHRLLVLWGGTMRWPILGLAMAALASSAALVPSQRELAILDMEAGDLDRAIAELERAIAAGDTSAITAATLARALAETADVARAVSVLEALRASGSRDVALLEMLADYYESIGYRADRVSVLVDIQAQAPTMDRQQEIARLYGEVGDVVRQRAALWTLVNAFDAEVDDFLALARMEAAAANPEAGANALRMLHERHPEAVDLEHLTLEVSLRLAAGDGAGALAHAAQWFDEHPQYAHLVTDVSDIFAAYRRPDLTTALLTPIADRIVTADILEALIWAKLHLGERRDARRRLVQLDAMATDAAGWFQVLYPALSLNDRRRAIAASKRIGFDALPVSVLPELAMAATREGAGEVLAELSRMAESERVADDPLAAARLHLALGRREAARQYADLAEEGILDPNVAVQVARLELALGRRGRALAATRIAAGVRAETLAEAQQPLSRIPTDLATSGSIEYVAELYLRLDSPREGAAMLDALRRRQRSTAADEAWALVAAAAGRSRDVAEWLRASDPNGRHSVGFVRNLLYSALRGGDVSLAVRLAGELATRRGRQDDVLLLAELRVAGGHPWAAALSPVQPRSPEVRPRRQRADRDA